jgi:5-methylcytosine-specific restriction endonuclease McrA
MQRTKRYKLDWRGVWDKTNGRCFYCHNTLPDNTELFDDQGKACVTIRNWDIDHVIPLSRGGTNHIDNLAPSCKGCNHKKSDKIIEAL